MIDATICDEFLIIILYINNKLLLTINIVWRDIHMIIADLSPLKICVKYKLVM